jgi:carboxymethylenebutenolidase
MEEAVDEDDLRQRAIALYDHFTHESRDRRAFLAEMTKLAGSAAAANALLGTIAANPAAAALTDPRDQRLVTGWLNWPDSKGYRFFGYMARPRAADRPLPAVLVVHENRGLNSYIQDVTRRLALAGFLALAPDFLSPFGRTPADEDRARDMIAKLDLPYTVANGVAAIRRLKNARPSNGQVGAVGFCWGGALVDRLAIAAGRELNAAVAFYGPTPNPDEARKVRAAMLLHYAGLDDRVNAGAGPWVKALKYAGVSVQRFDYPGVNHAFHNDTSPARYNKAAAELAWGRTITFLREHLKG